MQVLGALANIGLLLIGLVMLSQGSEYFVESASKLARSFGVSELFIGLTLVAIGTSLPEIVSSSAAVAFGSPDLAIGNILGSHIANLTLVVGLSAVFAPLASNAVVLERDAKVMILIVLFLGFSMFDPITPGSIVAYEGIILLLLFVVYILFLYEGRSECETCYQFHVFVDYLIRLRFLTTVRGLARKPTPRNSSVLEASVQETESAQNLNQSRHGLRRDMLIIPISALFVVAGAQFVIQGATYISYAWGISEGVIGLTVIALGTSLPEIMVSVNSARKGFGRLLIGNVIGSNIVNITLGFGFVVLLVPAAIELLTGAMLIGLSLLISAIFYYIIKKDWRVTKREGVFLLVAYVISQILLATILQLGAV